MKYALLLISVVASPFLGASSDMGPLSRAELSVEELKEPEHITLAIAEEQEDEQLLLADNDLAEELQKEIETVHVAMRE